MRSSLLVPLVTCALLTAVAYPDIFGTGDNQFSIDFVNISGDASSANGTVISQTHPLFYRTFTDPGDYRIGVYEITNDQWNKFTAAYGKVTGKPFTAYDDSPHFTGADVPVNTVSWYAIAQSVNWLNTSTGHAPAYKFTGTQGNFDYAFEPWSPSDVGYDAANPYRNTNAYYFLPTEDEWVKAAYWNGTVLQTYATKAGETPTPETGWNYFDSGYSTEPYAPWNVGSGSAELNGTFDMMGNVVECTESPWNSGNYLFNAERPVRGGSYDYPLGDLRSSYRSSMYPDDEYPNLGFRVASVPEPTTLLLVALGGLLIRRRHH